MYFQNETLTKAGKMEKKKQKRKLHLLGPPAFEGTSQCLCLGLADYGRVRNKHTLMTKCDLLYLATFCICILRTIQQNLCEES